MKFILAALAALAISAIIWPDRAHSQNQAICTDYRSAAANLLGAYGELSRVTLLADEGATRFELWTNETSGTWTIIRVRTNGEACEMAAGEGITHSGITLPSAPSGPTL